MRILVINPFGGTEARGQDKLGCACTPNATGSTPCSCRVTSNFGLCECRQLLSVAVRIELH